MEKIYGIKPILIPNGVDIKMYRPITSIQKEDNLVLFIERLNKEKGAFDAIKLAELLSEVNFAIAGKGSSERLVIDSLKKLRKYIINNKSTIAVFPSYRENFPLVNLETKACSTAVIASKIGFNGHIVHDSNSFLVKLGDVYAIKKYIEELIADNNLRKRIEENALETVKKYNWINIVDNLFIYR